MIRNLLFKVYGRIRRLFFYLDQKIMDREAEHESGIQRFRYAKPGENQQGIKEIVRLCRNSRIRGAVHVVREGAPDNLHSHSSVDGFWYVLKGRARFHGENDLIHGEIGEHEGLLIPHNTRYWYESASDEDLEILQVLAIHPYRGWHRENYEASRYDRNRVSRLEGRTDRD